jgi:flagellar basal-body rod modification protein FlgD
MAVNNVGSTTDSAAASEVARTTMDKDDFLKLFITSLQYQDPLNPMQNSEMMQQLSQLGMMEQVSNMKTAVEKMTEKSPESQAADAAKLVGLTVTSIGDDGTPIKGKVEKVSFNDGLTELLVAGKTITIGSIEEIEV